MKDKVLLDALTTYCQKIRERLLVRCKQDEITCDAFCSSPPPKKQLHQIKPCEPNLPCLVDGIRVVPSSTANIDCSELSAVGWIPFGGAPGDTMPKPEGFSGELSNANDWFSELKPTAYYELYPQEPPSDPDKYPATVYWGIRGCKEFYTGGDPPFDGVGKDFCERTGGNDLAGIYFTDPPADAEYCGIKDEGVFGPPWPVPPLINTSVNMSGSCESFSVSGFILAQPYAEDGYCELRVRSPSTDVSISKNGLDVTAIIQADQFWATVYACYYEPLTNPITGEEYISISTRGFRVALEGEVTVTWSFNPLNEPSGVCCRPDGKCLQTDEISCIKSCGDWSKDGSIEACENNCKVNNKYFDCWDFSFGEPPPYYVPAGPIGTDCEQTTKGGRTMPTTTTTGPGTELSKLLKMIGISPKEKGCQCKSHAKRMDREGPQWCRENIEKILGWLQTESKKRKLPFMKQVAKQVVLLAIRRAEKKS